MIADALPSRALPPGATLSTWAAPDGWVHRRYDRAGSGRGHLLFQTGRADMIEKYLETLDHFHARGWSVTAFDWRGQGGSGRLGDPDTGHLDDFAILVADLAAFWRGWRTGQGPHVVIGHSMGGYLTLAALAEGAIDADAAVLVAPMLGLRSPIGARAGAALAGWLAARGDPRRPAWVMRGTARETLARQRRLTHDLARFAEQERWRAARPDLAIGAPSWHWLVQAFAATAALRADPRLASVATPVQMILADADRLVDPRAARAVAARLPDAEVQRFGREAAHEILRESDPVRTRALSVIDDFLDRRAPARPSVA